MPALLPLDANHHVHVGEQLATRVSRRRPAKRSDRWQCRPDPCSPVSVRPFSWPAMSSTMKSLPQSTPWPGPPIFHLQQTPLPSSHPPWTVKLVRLASLVSSMKSRAYWFLLFSPWPFSSHLSQVDLDHMGMPWRSGSPRSSENTRPSC